MRIAILIFILLVAIAGGVLLYSRIANGPGAPIQQEFEKKIIYTSDQGVDVEELRQDCSLRGGEFNECGSPCAEGEVCIQVCAFTCQLK